MSDYPVPAESIERKTEIKKSRFLARVSRVGSRSEAMSFLAAVKTDYPDARHHCWAYQIGQPGAASQAAMNDDGEPSGTGGKPILNVIQHKEMGDVMVVVTRYFGGIKLGAGGLVRAYAGATEAVLSAVPRHLREILLDVDLYMSFAHEQPVRHWCQQNGAEVHAVDYSDKVVMHLLVPETTRTELIAWCQAQNIKPVFTGDSAESQSAGHV